MTKALEKRAPKSPKARRSIVNVERRDPPRADTRWVRFGAGFGTFLERDTRYHDMICRIASPHPFHAARVCAHVRGTFGGMVATASRYAGRTPAALRHRSVARLGVFACAFLVAVVCFGASSGALGSDVDAGSSRSGSLRAASGRAMLESDGDGSLYPPDAFTESQLKRGAVFLHAFGVLYTFVAIAICLLYTSPSPRDRG